MMTCGTSAYLLKLLDQRAYELEGKIKSWSRRGGKTSRDKKDKLIALARNELIAIAQARVELKDDYELV